MKINRAQYEEAYKAGKKYYEKKLGLTEAKKSLAAIGINPNSAGDLVFNVRRMLDGERFTRSLICFCQRTIRGRFLPQSEFVLV
ncbi:MAG TPA: hypothetical protein VMD27_11145 [Candidatus Aquilonibacter sp.]|nr:hypothetical protein [Candidatus Aquilonibacter sp.]